ncbi:MAG: hypothetical protein KC636_29670 [Myxococcales bacterium]|nr:hypothetical protein [Myxococcales bacterium]
MLGLLRFAGEVAGIGPIVPRDVETVLWLTAIPAGGRGIVSLVQWRRYEDEQSKVARVYQLRGGEDGPSDR